MQPKEGNTRIYAIYFILFAISFRVFLVRLFAATMLNSYLKFNNCRTGFDLLTKSQQEWITIRSCILQLNPRKHFKPEDSVLQLRVFLFVKSNTYKNVYNSVIFLNVFVLSLKWHRQMDQMSYIFDLLNILFISSLGVNVFLQAYARGNFIKLINHFLKFFFKCICLFV